eukprot:3925160-Pleurochrysis_carterae.AAC.1
MQRQAVFALSSRAARRQATGTRRVILGLRCASPCSRERLQPFWAKTLMQESAFSEMKVARRPGDA